MIKSQKVHWIHMKLEEKNTKKHNSFLILEFSNKYFGIITSTSEIMLLFCENFGSLSCSFKGCFRNVIILITLARNVSL